MLPFKNGVEIINSIRKLNIQTPVILLTARDETSDIIGLTKPFSFEELLARTEGLHRRNISGGNDEIDFKNIYINLASKIIKKMVLLLIYQLKNMIGCF